MNSPYRKSRKDPDRVAQGKAAAEKRWRNTEHRQYSLTDAKIEKEKLAAELKRRELSAIDNATVDRELVYIAWAAIAANVKAKLTPIGSKIAQFVLGMKTVAEVREAIDREVHDALAELDGFVIPEPQAKKGAARAQSRRVEADRVSDRPGANQRGRSALAVAAKAQGQRMGRSASDIVARERF
jgi:hypothetical protein